MQSLAPDPIAPLLPRLHARARRLTRSPDDAEDLTQETALRLCQALARTDEINTPDAYAMTVLHNLARQRWRQRKPTEALEDDMALTAPAAPARIACAELRAAIARLPKDQSDLMNMVIAGESSPNRLAALTGVPKGTVMSRLARARRTLRSDMGLADGAPVSELF